MNQRDTLRNTAPRSRARPCLGLLVDRIDDTYQNELLLRIAEAARRRDVSLLCFAGAPLEPSLSEARNRVYELAGPDNVDGIILSAGSLENRIGSARLLDYLDRFRPLPICSIGVALPEMASILVDNTVGTRQVVDHLIGVHGRRRIAFIRGPTANDEADQRYRAYLRALTDARIRPDNGLVVDGDFLPASGAQAIATLLDQRSAEFDAVVAANDHMALGALDALLARGIAVPESVAVVGFDDIEDGRVALRPLTTVRQPLATLGEKAVQTALAQLAGERPHKQVLVETELLPRRSCGCQVQRQLYEVSSPQRPAGDTPQASLIDKRAQIVADVVDAAPELPGTDWADRLVGAFVDQLCVEDGASFAAAVDDIATRVLDARGELDPIHQAMTALRRSAVPALLDCPSLLVSAETLLHEGRVLLTRAVERRETQRRLQVEELTRALGQLGQALSNVPHLGQLGAVVEAFLPRLSMPSCHLSLFSPQDGKNMMRLAMSAGQLGSAEPSSFPPFPATFLVPESLLPDGHRYAFVVEPLYRANDPIGIALFEMGPSDGSVYEVLRTQVAGVLGELEGARQHAADLQDRHALLRRLVKAADAVRRAHAHIPSQDADPPPSTGPDALLERLDQLVDDCVSLSGEEMDTLRPGPPHAPDPDGEAGTAGGR